MVSPPRITRLNNLSFNNQNNSHYFNSPFTTLVIGVLRVTIRMGTNLIFPISGRVVDHAYVHIDSSGAYPPCWDWNCVGSHHFSLLVPPKDWGSDGITTGLVLCDL